MRMRKFSNECLVLSVMISFVQYRLKFIIAFMFILLLLLSADMVWASAYLQQPYSISLENAINNKQ